MPARLAAVPPKVTVTTEMPLVAPADDPVVPAPEQTGPDVTSTVAVATPPATRRKGRYGYILGCLLVAAAFAAAGYVWGTRYTHSAPSDSIGRPHVPAPASAAATLPDKTTTATATSFPKGVPTAPASPSSEAEAALRAFLEAPDWQARAAFVISAAQERPAMRDFAAAHGDGPIPFTSLNQLEKSANTTIFKLGTPVFPDGFPVAVVDVGDGPKVDWESFIGFHDDQFWKFAQGPADHSGIFYVLARPDQAAPGPEATNFARYLLSVPMPGRSLSVWIRRDSVGFARLRSVFAGSGGFEEEVIRRLDATGVPVVLALAKHQTADGRTFVEIEDVVAVGWGPRVEAKKAADPGEPEEENVDDMR